MNQKSQIHLIGSAHLDPVWLWRYPEGLAEIKATFRSALDRIQEKDTFIFTSACAFYYKWVEENCPQMFREIQEAVKNEKWCIVGGMWIQPDCNIPSSESFARHMLYSQNYFMEKFGCYAVTGYNVDSFGHSAGLPRLLQKGGMKNYVYMRPYPGDEMQYPFDGGMFLWECGEESCVKTFRIYKKYARNLADDEPMREYDELIAGYPYSTMFFYGVGNHGGGPTRENLRIMDEFIPTAKNPYIYSSPDRCFEEVPEDGLPHYAGELQNHASGCYCANAPIKAANRSTESRLTESDALAVLANQMIGYRPDTEKSRDAWQALLFNQFHDILCGCITQSAQKDALVFFDHAKAQGMRQITEATQMLSWGINTAKEGACHSKESRTSLWESNNLGTPIVVFNPLSHPVRVPVMLHMVNAAAITDEKEVPVPFQKVRGDYANRTSGQRLVWFRQEIPAWGWRTFWAYKEKEFPPAAPEGKLTVHSHMLQNDCITVKFHPATGNIASITASDGRRICGKTETVFIDDSKNDTWAHGNFVFDKVIGKFKKPSFHIVENGPCKISLKVTQSCRKSRLEQTYTLYPGEDTVHVSAHLVLNDPLVMVGHTFESGLKSPAFTREVPGGTVTVPITGRELPMLRWMLMEEKGAGIAIVNDSKNSCCAMGGQLRMIAARSCYYADHYGEHGKDMGINAQLQDIGEHDYQYAIVPYAGDPEKVVHTAEELNTEFPAIAETYHEGPLPLCYSGAQVSPGVSVSCIKPAEDGDGVIVRLTETKGQKTEFHVQILGADIRGTISPNDIRSFRIIDGTARECDFREAAL